MERVIIRAKSRYSPESVVGTGNCTLPYFCDSGQGEKKVTVGSVSGGSVGLPETRTFFFLALSSPVYKGSLMRDEYPKLPNMTHIISL